MKNFIKDENGASLVLTVLVMVVLISFTALAIDGGNLYFRHTRLQDVADACALAGCSAAGDSKNHNQALKSAVDSAIKYANLNNLTATNTADIIYGEDEQGEMRLTVSDFKDSKWVTVEILVDTNLYFARVLGLDTTRVAVSATASADPVKAMDDLMPIGFIWSKGTYQVGVPMDIDLTGADKLSGNCGYLDFDTLEGAEYAPYQGHNFKDYLKDGFGGFIPVGETIYTEPGEMVGHLDEALNGKKGKNDGKITGCNQ